MPGKSRRSRRKPSRSKRREGSLRTVVAQQPAVPQTHKPVSQPKASAPSVSAPTPIATQTAAHYPYIVSELRRIGILAGVIMAVLVVLFLVLS